MVRASAGYSDPLTRKRPWDHDQHILYTGPVSGRILSTNHFDLRPSGAGMLGV